MPDRVPEPTCSGLHMSHFESCQLSLIWLAHITLNYWQPTHFYVGKCDTLFQIVCKGKTTSFSSEPARWSCDNCQWMSDFDSCQFILIRMAYITDRLVSIIVQDLM